MTQQWNKGLAGNAGVYLAAWQLSRVGFAVAVTSRNMKGPDLIAINEESESFSIQVKASAGLIQDVSFGLGPVTVREPWWIFVAHAMTSTPAFYVLSRENVVANLGQDSGVRSRKAAEERLWWFPARNRCRPGHIDELIEYRDAWHKLHL